MNVLYMNSLECRVAENRVRMAQVSIAEHQGKWQVLWSEPKENGRLMQQAWYEGTSWEELMQAFREGIREKQNDGYAPLVSMESREEGRRSRTVSALQCYAELHMHQEAFTRLRQWRWNTAVKEGKASFIIASNRMLQMLAAYLPHHIEELKQIPGFGEQKAQQFGSAILSITGDYERETEFPLDWVERKLSRQELDEWTAEKQQAKIKLEQNRSRLKQQLIEGIRDGLTLEELSRNLSMRRSDVLVLVEQADREDSHVDSWLEQELAALPDEEKTLVYQLFAAHGDRFLKPILGLWHGEEDSKGREVSRQYELLRMLRIRFRWQQTEPPVKDTQEPEERSADMQAEAGSEGLPALPA